MSLANARRRYYRTVFLGVSAMVLLLWTAVDQFGLSWREMSSLFVTVLIGALLLVLLAATMAALWIGLRRLIAGRDTGLGDGRDSKNAREIDQDSDRQA